MTAIVERMLKPLGMQTHFLIGVDGSLGSQPLDILMEGWDEVISFENYLSGRKGPTSCDGFFISAGAHSPRRHRANQSGGGPDLAPVFSCFADSLSVQSGQDGQEQLCGGIQPPRLCSAGRSAVDLVSTSELYGDSEVYLQPEAY